MWPYGWFESWEDIMPREGCIVEVVLVSDGNEEPPPLQVVLDRLPEH